MQDKSIKQYSKMMSIKQYKAAVIGLGNIGLGYDYSCPNDERIMTHSAAYFYHPGYELIAAVDVDPKRRSEFTKKYHAPAYESVDSVSADVFSIAVPTEYHYDTFCQLLPLRPKVILCEKPCSGDRVKAEKMRQLAEENNILLLINYMRRYGPGLKNIKHILEQGLFGKINTIIVKYSNGFINCASHFLDVLQFLFGTIESIVRVKGSLATGDAEIDVKCQISETTLYFISTGQIQYSFYEFEIIGERGVLRYGNAGRDISYQLISEDSGIDGAYGLSETLLRCENDYLHFQWHVLDAIYHNINKNDQAVSNIDDVIHILKLIEMLQKEEVCA